MTAQKLPEKYRNYLYFILVIIKLTYLYCITYKHSHIHTNHQIIHQKLHNNHIKIIY